MINILIAGDTCPIEDVEPYFINGDKKTILNGLYPLFDKSDFSLLNLECPLIRKKAPIVKDGPVLGVDVSCIKGIKNIGINAVNLSNNHILDHGEDGLKSTIEACNSAGVSFFGAGKNSLKASKPLIKKIKNKFFCFIGIAEHEFSIAQTNSYGANSIDVIDSLKVLKKYKKEVDFVIMLIHGGKEYYKYPTPNLQKLSRFFVSEGADAIICQHSHCVGTIENYNNRPIIYGQGNFIFESLKKKKSMWYEGMLVSLTFNNDKVSANYIPFKQSDGFLGAKRLNQQEEEIFLNSLYNRSKKIESTEFVDKQWKQKCKDEKYLYASRVRGHNRILRYLNKKIHFSDWFYSKATKLTIRNVVECEVHREGLETLWRDKDIDF